MGNKDVPQEAEFHGVLFTRLQDYISKSETVFGEPTAEKSTDSGFADIYIPSALSGDLVIEIKRDDIYPRDRDVIRQARNYADNLDTRFFATCTSNDFFLYYYKDEINISEIEFLYFNLRNQQISDFVGELLSAVRHVYSQDEFPLQQERDRIIGILRSFHSSVWTTYKKLARKKYGQNEQFIRSFDMWVRENDYLSLSESEQFEIASKQYAYLLTNRVLFYEVVREKTRAQYDPESEASVTPVETKSGFSLDPLTDYTSTENLDRHLRKQFQEIIDEIDYRPVFEQKSDLFSTFPENQKTLRMLEDFITNIESERITELNEDLLGEIYEELIPAEERRELGQFYTHPRIAETLSKWAISRPDEDVGQPSETPPRVLDPACGSGTFTVESYKILRKLYPNASHQEIIDKLVAVDINRFPLHLTALNLTSQNIKERTDRLHILHDSFFDIDPETDSLVDNRIVSGEEVGEVGMFDAVVGNPPYIRQGDLHPNKPHFRTHLSTFGRSKYTTYLDGSKSLSKKSDAYVYFVTHATQFLREGGRLGFIIPSKWLTTRYGKSLQQFLFDHYKIEGIVGFNSRAFEDALVDTVLLMIERCEDKQERRDTTVPFVRVRESMDAEDIIDTVGINYHVPEDSYMKVRDRPAYRVTAVEQSYLKEAEAGKLLPYIRAPSEFIELLEHPDLVQLSEVGDVKYGQKTGANNFFFISEEERKQWNIDEKFLLPAIKSIRDVDSRVVRFKHTQKYLFDIHNYVQQTKNDATGLAGESDLEIRVKNALERDGYSGTLAYINWGENQKEHTGSTCESRDVWFNLGKMKPPEILHPKFFNERVYTIDNPDKLMPSNAIDSVNMNPSIDSDAMVGFFNSTVYKALLETWGRAEGGGALQLMTYEVSSVPVLDIRQLTPERKERLADNKDMLINGDESAQEKIDELILDIIGVDVSVERFRKLYHAMVQRRISSGAEAEILVEEIEQFDGEVTRTFSRQSGETSDLSEYM